MGGNDGSGNSKGGTVIKNLLELYDVEQWHVASEQAEVLPQGLIADEI
jgi:hypothetical protein